MKEEQLKKILNDMSLKEKIGQLIQLSGDFYDSCDISLGPNRKLGLNQDSIDLCGSVFNVTGAKNIRKLQKEQMAKQPHHIPMLFMSDVIYGFKTIFPSPLGLGALWDEKLIFKIYKNISEEAWSSGNQVAFSPMVDIVHDSRWGRVMESPGEDTLLNSRYAAAMVNGFQAELKDGKGQAACVKHFAAYGAVEAGREYNQVDMSISKLANEYLPPYKAAVDAGVKMVMTSLTTLNGVPSTGDKWLLSTLLRNKWNFQGSIISDYASVYELKKHGFSVDDKDSAEKAINAGVDIDMKTPCYAKYLEELVAENKVNIKVINSAVFRVLKLKNELGLFEDPYRNCSNEQENYNILSKQKRKLAREVVTQSSVLLKNKDMTLPLSPINKILLVGPYANNKNLIGSWAIHGNPEDCVSIYEGIKNKVGSGRVKYIQGTNLEDNQFVLSVLGNNARNRLSEEDQIKQLREINDKAKSSDAIVVAVGEDSTESGEAASKTNLHLPECQKRLIKELAKLNKPIVMIVISGRPLVLTDVEPYVDSILYAWFPGTEAGNGIADILFGKVNPSGKLTISFPYNEGQEPMYYSQLLTGRPLGLSQHTGRYVSRYLDAPNKPLYPFGYGLSYGKQIEYKNLKISNRVIKRDSKLTLSVDIENSSNWDKNEVVQLYLHDDAASIVQPIKKLIDYKKIPIKRNTTKTVKFTISPDQLSFFDNNMQRKLENGVFHVYVGSSSETTLSTEFELQK